jgi:hypothetical protein
MASSSSSNKENNYEKGTTSSISIIRYDTRARQVSREHQLLHRTRSGGVGNSSSPQNTSRKSNLSQEHSAKMDSASPLNTVSNRNASDDTDEDIDEQTNIVLSRKKSSILFIYL